MNNKFLIRLYVPLIETSYEIWIPPGKTIGNIITLLVKAVMEQSKGYYNPEALPNLFNKNTAEIYNPNEKVINTNIRNGTELILI